MKREVPAPLTVLLVLGIWGFGLSPQPGRAQGDGGDQFLDGIGETALVARYLFNGDTADRSRNGRHATLRGLGGTYVEDPRFGKVLSLPGSGGAFAQLPGEVLEGVEAITVTGWVRLRSSRPWQRFFDFGLNAATNFFCSPVGDGGDDGFRARITLGGSTGEQGPGTAAIPTNRWVHLAVVLDPAREALELYRDGAPAAHTVGVTVNLGQVLDPSNPSCNQLSLGRSNYEADPTLDAMLHDVRLYSVALTETQVAAVAGRDGSTGAAVAAAGDRDRRRDAEEAAGTVAWPFELVSVPEIRVETAVGTLPRLPRTVPGRYRDGMKGPEVRILWPAPTNNDSVLAPGTHTVTGRIVGAAVQPVATVRVKPAPPRSHAPSRSLEAFPLDRVRLEPGSEQRLAPFVRHRDKFVQGLAQTDPDRFLYMFRDAFGQQQPEGVHPLDGWDSRTTRLRGHATGHYLSAIAQAYASAAHDPALRTNFLQKMDYLTDTLHNLSRKSGRPVRDGEPCNPDPVKVPPGPGRKDYDSDLSAEGIRTDFWNWGLGYLSAYPPDQFILLERGATYGGGNHQVWAPYYTLHKILAGLLDCYEVGGNRKALEIAEGMGRWVHQRLQVVPADTRIRMWNRYIAGEYGGMNEVMVRLARLTGDRRFLECARLFDNVSFFFGDAEHTHGLARNVDTLRGKHANQHIPQVLGALETYRATGNPAYYRVAEHFWDLCTQGYMYSIGGVAGARNPDNAECFTAEPDSLFHNGFARGGQNETCATYNLLKLSRALFLFGQDAAYMDYYERALYNDILASVAADDAGNTYHIPLNPGARKQFGNAAMDGFTCCNGTALESGTKLQDSIYFHGTNHHTLFVNLFVPSTLRWTERNVVLTQRTRFPYEDTTRLTLRGGGEFALMLRVPQWATRANRLTIQGQPHRVTATPGSYLELRRNWDDNTTIEWQMPFSFHLDRVMDRPDLASLFYGPILLAADEQEARSDWRPVTLNAADLGAGIVGDPAALHFSLGDITFRPFFESYGRYSVYLKLNWRRD